MERLKAKLETAKTKIETKDEAQIKTLSGHDTTGTMLQTIVQSYFGLNDIQDEILERRLGVVSNSFMSFGTFSTSLQGVYSWGVLRTVKFAGMVMDIDRIGATLVDKDNKQSNVLAFTQQQGPRQSLNENLVPEQFFNDPNSAQKNVKGISAVKALKLANDQGQKIYQIDQSNINIILPQLNHESQVITDISNAVSAGKIVTTSQTKVSLNGWNGSGYIITDPNTGSGAYMISGGLNGGALPPIPDGIAGALTGIAQAMFLTSAIGLVTSLAGFGAPLIALVALIFIIMVITIALLEIDNLLGKNAQECRETWFGVTSGILGIGYAGGIKVGFVAGLAYLLQLLYSPDSNRDAWECFTS